jgi:ribosomal protein L23
MMSLLWPLRLSRTPLTFCRSFATVKDSRVEVVAESSRSAEDEEKKEVEEVVNARHGRPPRRLPKTPDPEKAQRIFFPNVPMVLVRNSTSPGEEYDPYTATFRCSTKLAKPDIQAYLTQIYKLDITSLRTMIYMGKVVRDLTGLHRKGGYKKVVVGLKDPFWYPEERSQKWLDDEFG